MPPGTGVPGCWEEPEQSHTSPRSSAFHQSAPRPRQQQALSVRPFPSSSGNSTHSWRVKPESPRGTARPASEQPETSSAVVPPEAGWGRLLTAEGIRQEKGSAQDSGKVSGPEQMAWVHSKAIRGRGL